MTWVDCPLRFFCDLSAGYLIIIIIIILHHPKNSPIGETFKSMIDPMASVSGYFPVRNRTLGDSYHRVGCLLSSEESTHLDDRMN